MMPPIQVFISLFRNFQPIMESMSKMKGTQTHGKPEVITKEIDGITKYIVIEKTVFTDKDDVNKYLDIAQRFYTMKI